jgi:hypothetical protein
MKMIIDFGDGDIAETEIPEFSVDDPVPDDLRQSGEWLAEAAKDAADYLSAVENLQQANWAVNDQTRPLLKQLHATSLVFRDVPFDGHIKEFSTWIKQPGVLALLPAGFTWPSE